MPTGVCGLAIRWEALPRFGAGSGNVVRIVLFVIRIGIRRGLMLPLAYTNEGEVMTMGTKVRANRPVNKDHMAPRERCWPLIEGDLGPLWGDGKGDADCLQESVRPRTSHHHDDRCIDRPLMRRNPH